MLLPQRSGKRAGALAASLTLQTAAAGALLLIPLIYSDRLPLAQPSFPLFLPPVPAFDPVVTRTRGPSGQRRASLLPFRPFVPSDLRAGNEPRAVGEIGGPDIDVTFAAQGIGLPPGLMFVPLPPPPAPVSPAEHAPTVVPTGPVLIPSDVQAAKLIRKVVPIYPRLAVMTRVSGDVRLTGTIAKNGTVHGLQVIDGHPLLVRAAVDAVRQWVYAPTLLRGEPVEVITTIDVHFRLAQ